MYSKIQMIFLNKQLSFYNYFILNTNYISSNIDN